MSLSRAASKLFESASQKDKSVESSLSRVVVKQASLSDLRSSSSGRRASSLLTSASGSKRSLLERESSFHHTDSKRDLLAPKFAKDEDLWAVMVLVLQGMELDAVDAEPVRHILGQLEAALRAPPNRAKSLQAMERVVRVARDFVDTRRRETAAVRIQTVFRGCRARAEYRMIRSLYGGHLPKGMTVLRDLIGTERVCVRCLQALVKEYFIPLREGIAKKLIGVPLLDVNNVFSRIEALIDIHENFLDQLKEIEAAWPPVEAIGQSFLSMLAFWYPYADYAATYAKNLDTVNRHSERDEKFAAFLAEIAEKSPDLGDLPTLLSLPLLHFVHYDNALQTLLGITEPSSGDFESLMAAFSSVNGIAEDILQSLQQAERQATMLSINRRLEFESSEAAEECWRANKQFHREGTVSVVLHKSKKKRAVFVFNSACIIAKQESRFKYKHKQTIRLADATIDPMHDPSKFNFKLVSASGTSSATFSFRTAAEKDEWMQQLQSLIHVASSRGGSRKSQVTYAQV
eukprot:TRINITY_DN12131_c0_g1_i1.p1 TRINITY_DN12131_c0_g1~~TRINITY_DN12131_c0_g1_i1.p1  ORF type:complete len:517 (+),score=205.37 TRINITY_DN12131_c0_g1_i1:203-1753(+)